MDVVNAGYLYSAILLRKLPNNIRDRINRQAKKADSWDLPKFREAIQNEIQLLADSQPETIFSSANTSSNSKKTSSSKSFKPSSPKKGGTISNFNIQSKPKSKDKPKGCPLCLGSHRPWECPTSTVDSRLKEIANKSLCYNCLGSHAVRVCTSNYNCGARHNSCKFLDKPMLRKTTETLKILNRTLILLVLIEKRILSLILIVLLLTLSISIQVAKQRCLLQCCLFKRNMV